MFLARYSLQGAGVSAGYINQVELTNDRFLVNESDPTTKFYRTGDVGRWSEDGTIEFFGRIDHQVKIRGYRLELGEVENSLTKHPMINDAIVKYHKDAIGDEQLIAFYTSYSSCRFKGIDLISEITFALVYDPRQIYTIRNISYNDQREDRS